MTNEDRQLVDLVRGRRRVRKAGVTIGVGCVLACSAVGTSTGLFDASVVGTIFGTSAAVATATIAATYISNDERAQSLDELSSFEVRPCPGKGDGLYAIAPIAAGTYLFDYEGECLDEGAFFARYPDANGRYIACINDNLYIDGIDPKLSNSARWMNHAPSQQANVMWRKQRMGPQGAMHFYATRSIAAGEALEFDYGDEYWTALGETPV